MTEDLVVALGRWVTGSEICNMTTPHGIADRRSARACGTTVPDGGTVGDQGFLGSFASSELESSARNSDRAKSER